jgi:nucleoside-diphosphate-sugar epimerase
MILVTGGTGLVGAHLLLHLLRNDIPIRAIHRKGSDLKRIERVFGYYVNNPTELFKRIDWVETDLSDIPVLETAFKNVDYVYHAAALISFDPNDYELLMKTNAEGTANIVNLCIANTIKKFCYVSTIGAIGKSLNDAIATEENEWNDQAANVYGRSKYAAEIEVWRGAQEGLPVVMVNPGVIVGPGFWGSGSGTLFSTANKGYKFYPPGGTGFISVHDVIRMMVTLMDSPIKNERYISVAENLSFQEILTRITEKLGKPQPKKKLKFWQLEIGRIADAIWNLLTGHGRRITKNSIRSMKRPEIYSNEKVKEALNFEFVPLDAIIKLSCDRFTEENP